MDNFNKNPEEIDDLTPDIIDLDGEPFESIDVLEIDGVNYVALVPYVEDLDNESDEEEFIIMKEVEENGEYFLETIDDDELYTKIGEAFLEHLNQIFEEFE